MEFAPSIKSPPLKSAISVGIFLFLVSSPTFSFGAEPPPTKGKGIVELGNFKKTPPTPKSNGIPKNWKLRVWQGQPDVKVVFVSGYSPEAMAEYGLIGDDVVFLQKPFLLSDLEDTIRMVLESGDAPDEC